MNRARETFYKSLATRALSKSPHHDPRFPPSPYYRFFKVLAAIKKPNLSVELGLCGGGGSFHLASGWPGGKVVGVELPDGVNGYRAPPNYLDNWAFIQQQCRNFVLWRGDSVESAPEIFRRYGPADFLFIDTVHEYQRTLDEFNAWLPYLSKRAVVCLDDLRRDGMQEAWDAIPGQKLRLDHLHPGQTEGGFGVVWGGW